MFQSTNQPKFAHDPEKNDLIEYTRRHRHYVNRGCSFDLTLGSSSMFIIIFQLHDLPWSISTLHVITRLWQPNFIRPVLSGAAKRRSSLAHTASSMAAEGGWSPSCLGKAMGFSQSLQYVFLRFPKKWKLVTS